MVQFLLYKMMEVKEYSNSSIIFIFFLTVIVSIILFLDNNDIHNETKNNSVCKQVKNLNVISYNVAHYNNDSNTYINEKKILNLKEMIFSHNPEIVGLQEDREFVDEALTKATHKCLYSQVFPYKFGVQGMTILSKINGQSDVVTFTNGRGLRYAYLDINGKKLLIISTHPTVRDGHTSITSDASVKARFLQYTQLFQWVFREIKLCHYKTKDLIACQDWEWCIITGDMNSITYKDRLNLKILAEQRDFNLANGGKFGWKKTHNKFFALDNIICSKNVAINSVVVMADYAEKLYSDHYPIIASLTLLNE